MEKTTFEDNIKMNLTEIRFENVYWIQWAWDRVQRQAVENMVMNLKLS
jgi:hypothetical protein